MKKTIVALSVILILTFVIFGMTFTASADQTYGGYFGADGDNLSWSFDPESGTLTISGEGRMENFNYDYVNSTGGPWHDFRNDITNIVIGEGVTNISFQAFYNLVNVYEIKIPDSVKEIGDYAFEGCTGLRKVDIGNGVQYIGDCAFERCFNVYSLTIGEGLGTGGYVFPVQTGAFEDCRLLVEIYDLAPAYLVQRSDADPIGHSSISVKTDASVPSNIVKDDQGYVFYVDEAQEYYFLLDYEGSDTDLVLPESINGNPYIIRANAFYDRSGLNSIKIPDSVKGIQRDAFFDSSLIDMDSIGAQYVDKWIIHCPPMNKEYTIREDTVGIADWAFRGSDIEELIIPDSVKIVGNQAFENCSSLISVNIGSGVQRVGTWAFRNCRNLTYISGASGVRSFGHQCFDECVNLSAVFIYDLENWCTISFDNGGTANPLYYADEFHVNDILVRDLVIPQTVTYISKEAFAGANRINTVYIGENVTEIGQMAFSGCDNIKHMTIPFVGKNVNDNISKFGYFFGSAHDNAAVPDSIERVDILASTQLPQGAFLGVTNLKFVSLPNTLTSISESAFGGCHSLIRIVIPESIERIHQYAFTGCFKLVEIQNLSELYFAQGTNGDGDIALNALNIYKDNSDSNIQVVDDFIFYFDYEQEKYILLAYSGSETDITLPHRINGKIYTINAYAFANCTDLVSVTIPEGIKYIGDNAFYNCKSIEAIAFPSTIEYVGSNILASDSLEYTVYENAMYIGDTTNPYTILVSAVSQDIQRCDIHPSTKVIYDNAFSLCSNLTYIEIPNGVTSINYNAFANTGIKAITIPASVKNISVNAFAYCDLLEEITILTDSVVIGECAFMECPSIVTLNVPANVLKSVQNGAQLTAVNRITINSGEVIYDNMFHGFPSLKTIWLPDTITEVGENLFEYDASIDFVNYEGAYYLGSLNNNHMLLIKVADTSLKEIKIHPDTKYICNQAFKDMYDLKEIAIPDSVVTIGSYAFYDCSALSSVKLGKGVEKIDSCAFYGCGSLANVRVPDGIKFIGDSAFTSAWNCYITAVYCGDNISDISGYEGLVISQHLYYYGYDDTEHYSKCYYCEHQTPSVDHALNDGTCVVEPTHFGTGIMEYSCECGYTSREDIPMISHEWDEGYISIYPTHTSEGIRTYYCNCGESKSEPIEKLDGHTYDGGTTTKYPTHLEDGIVTYTCECGDTYTETIPKDEFDHTWDDPEIIKEATHLEYGSVMYTCACGETFEDSIPKLEEHEWDTGTVSTEPTHFSGGVKTFTCGCGETYTEDIPILAEHVFGEWQSVSEDQHSRYCECGEYEYQDHAFGADGRSCAECGYQKEIHTTEKQTDALTEETKPSQPQEPEKPQGDGSSEGCGSSLSGVSIMTVSLIIGFICIVDNKKNKR